MDIQAAIDYALMREREERLGIKHAPTLAIRDAHFVLAERYADQAWSLQEKQFDSHVNSKITADTRPATDVAVLVETS